MKAKVISKNNEQFELGSDESFGSRLSNLFFNSSNKNKTIVEQLSGLRTCLDMLQINVFVADKNLNLIYMNKIAENTMKAIEPEIQKAFGLRVENLLGGSIHRFHKDPNAVEAVLRNHSALPHKAELEFGNVILRSTINGLWDQHGQVHGYIVNWDEVKELKEMEAEQARMSSMMENAPFNILFADKDLILKYANPASIKTLKTLEQYLPVPAEKMVGECIDIFHKNPRHQRNLLGDPRNLPHNAQIQLGPEILDLNVSAIYDQEGNHSGAMVNWSVITEQLQLKKNNEEMVRVEKERSEDLDKKVNQLLDVCNAASKGDLTKEINVEGQDSIGKMGEGLKSFITILRKDIEEIGRNSESVGAAAEELTATSTTMSANAEETSAQAGVVASASEEVGNNVQTVATGAEEMSASIGEISSNASQAAKVSGEAVVVAKKTNETIGTLGESSKQIGEVVKVITSIAEQTNLLALNATIEAARAGEAGKGFAVVANEVKELANQTAKATEEISGKVQTIQTDTGNAVEAISEIGDIINKINDISSTIASAVEEQSATTNEMSRNVSEAAKGVAEISHNISGVSTAAEETTQGSSQTKDAATELSRLAVDMQKLVTKFKI
jgi:methyl-accepting chemotaxis protein